jgi:hypothetical protein
MKPGRSPRSYWLSRLLRGRRLDRNPLRRKSDRIETALLGVLLTAFLAAAPFAARAAGSWAYAASAREAQAQQAGAHQVPATLLQAAPPLSAYAAGAAPDVDARWRAPDGQMRTGQVLVSSAAAAGSTVLVWTNQEGQLADPPLRHTQVVMRAEQAAVGAVISLAIMLFAMGWLARRSLDRRRLAAWDAEWLANGPSWRPRR